MSKYATPQKVIIKEFRIWEKSPTKPLVILLGWLGATTKALQKFHPFYTKRNCDILTIRPQPSHFLWPPKASSFSLELLKYLEEHHLNRPLIIHGFSIGCYMFAMLLVELSKKPEYAHLLQQVQGQVYDSVVVGGLKQMAVGVSNSIHRNGAVRATITTSLMTYFSLTSKVTVENYDKGIEAFKNSPVRAPYLFFYCLTDPMCDPDSLDSVMTSLKGHGYDVNYKCWPKSIHAQHLKNYPEEYEEILENFLDKIGMGVDKTISKL
ncbi:transmembrane protein 53-like [Glandiceps talaboti]